MDFIIYIILCAVSVVGTIGNVFIIGAVCLSRRLRVRGNVFIINLAVADLIITSYIMPIGLATAQYQVRHALCLKCSTICICCSQYNCVYSSQQVFIEMFEF